MQSVMRKCKQCFLIFRYDGKCKNLVERTEEEATKESSETAPKAKTETKTKTKAETETKTKA